MHSSAHSSSYSLSQQESYGHLAKVLADNNIGGTDSDGGASSDDNGPDHHFIHNNGVFQSGLGYGALDISPSVRLHCSNVYSAYFADCVQTSRFQQVRAFQTPTTQIFFRDGQCLQCLW
jgi:hypothetical protein